MAVAIDPKQTHRFVLPSEQGLPEDQKTVWLIRPQTVRSEREGARFAEKGQWYEYGLAVLRHCLAGWENFSFSDGTPVPFETDREGRATETALGRIHQSHKGEIVKAINDLGTSKLTETDLGN